MENQNYYSLEAISNSSLGWFKYSPKYFKKRLSNEIEDETKSYLELGKQLHMAVLEPNRFKKEFTHLEYEVPINAKQKEFCLVFSQLKGRKSIKEKSYNAYKQVYEVGKKAMDKVYEDAFVLYNKYKKYIAYLKKSEKYRAVLTTSTWNFIQDSIESLKKHKLANELLFKDDYGIFDDDSRSANNEFPIYWKFPLVEGIDTELDCKSLLDRLIIDHKKKVIKLIDVKTSYSLNKFRENFKEFSYHRQLAFYWMAVAWLFSNDYPEVDFSDYQTETYIITIQTKGLAECKVYTISDAFLTEGLEEILYLVKELCWHTTNDVWDYTHEYYEGDGAEKLK